MQSPVGCFRLFTGFYRVLPAVFTTCGFRLPVVFGCLQLTAVDGIRHWRDRGLVPAGLDPLRYAQVSWSTLHGMSRLLIDGIYIDSSAREAMCEAAADMFWRELSTAPAC
jgi:hypothetical protein